MTDHTQSIPSTTRAWAEVDLALLRANVRSVVRLVGPSRSVMAVVKADAYGHGLLPVARSALQSGAHWLGVATVAEGLALRAEHISAPIALLCAATPEDAPDIVSLALRPMVGDAVFAAALAAQRGSKPFEVHLDIDTGMGRSGVLPEHAVDLWRSCRSLGLTVNGLATHFGDADGASEAPTVAQRTRFREVRQALEGVGANFDWVHAGNSAAIMRFPADGCNLIRPGLLLYGLRPDCPFSDGLEAQAARSVTSVLTLKARVGLVRDLPAGHTISYGGTYQLSRDSRVATVLIGYGDGFPRRLSNGGEMLAAGRRAPILGRVCMDQTVIDVTDIDGIEPGDVVTCIGSDGAETITAEDLSRRIETTEHEITTCLTARLPRVYLNCESAS